MDSNQIEQSDKMARNIINALSGKGPTIVCQAMQALVREAGWVPQQEFVPGQATEREQHGQRLEESLGNLMTAAKELFDTLMNVKDDLCSTCSSRLNHHFPKEKKKSTLILARPE